MASRLSCETQSFVTLTFSIITLAKWAFQMTTNGPFHCLQREFWSFFFYSIHFSRAKLNVSFKRVLFKIDFDHGQQNLEGCSFLKISTLKTWVHWIYLGPWITLLLVLGKSRVKWIQLIQHKELVDDFLFHRSSPSVTTFFPISEFSYFLFLNFLNHTFLSLTFPISFSDFTIELLSKNLITK